MGHEAARQQYAAAPRGAWALAAMQLFIGVLVLFGSLGWFSALSGIASVGGVETTYHPTVGSRIAMAASGTFVWAFALACHLKVRRTWECGFGLLAVMWIWCLILSGLAMSEPVQEGHTPSAFFGVAGSLVCLGWGVWWYRQKGHFHEHGG